MNKKEVLQMKLDLLEEVLSDFGSNYTWNFRNKLKRSIVKLEGELSQFS